MSIVWLNTFGQKGANMYSYSYSDLNRNDFRVITRNIIHDTLYVQEDVGEFLIIGLGVDSFIVKENKWFFIDYGKLVPFFSINQFINKDTIKIEYHVCKELPWLLTLKLNTIPEAKKYIEEFDSSINCIYIADSVIHCNSVTYYKYKVFVNSTEISSIYFLPDFGIVQISFIGDFYTSGSNVYTIDKFTFYNKNKLIKKHYRTFKKIRKRLPINE